MQTVNQANGVIDDIHALPSRNLENLLLPARSRIVDAIICASILLRHLDLGR